MAKGKKVFQENDVERIRAANEISILDFAEKQGLEVIHIDNNTATISGESGLIINKKENTWHDKETNGKTIRFVSRIMGYEEAEGWKSALKHLDSNNYVTAEQYNQEHSEEIQEQLKEKADHVQQGLKKSEQVSIIDYAKQTGLNIKQGGRNYYLEGEKLILINPVRNTWSTLDDKVSRDVAAFVAEMEHISRKEAVERLNQMTFEKGELTEQNEVVDEQEVSENSAPDEQQKTGDIERKDQASSDMQTSIGEEVKIQDKPETIIRGYSAEQMKEILAGHKSRVDVSQYDTISFSSKQMKEIRLGLEHNVSVEKYQTPILSHEKMKEVRLGLERNVNLFNGKSPIELEKFDASQLKQIRLGMEQELDVRKFQDVSLSAEQMQEIRLGLKDNLNVSFYSSALYSPEQMSMVRKQMLLQKMIDHIKETIKELFEQIKLSISALFQARNPERHPSEEQLEEVIERMVEDSLTAVETESLQTGMESSFEEKMEKVLDSLKETIKEVEKELSTWKQQSKEESKEQIKELSQEEAESSHSKQSEEPASIEKYKEMNVFNELQLEEIEKGIRSGVDVSMYANPKYKDSDMTILRSALEGGFKKELIEREFIQQLIQANVVEELYCEM